MRVFSRFLSSPSPSSSSLLTFLTSFLTLSAFSLLTSCIYYSGPYNGDRDGWFNERGSGRTLTEVRPVSNISRVHLANQGDLSILLGETESLVVEADDNLLDLIRTDVRNGELHIYNQGNKYFREYGTIRYTLTVTSLDGIRLSSTGNIDAPDLEADQFQIGISSTGNLSLGSLLANDVDIRVSSTGDVMIRKLEADLLDVSISSTGHVGIRSGKVRNQEVRISSTGNFEAMDLVSDTANVRLNSTGSAFINVRDYLEARLSSTGSVHFSGAARTSIVRNSVGRAIQVGQR